MSHSELLLPVPLGSEDQRPMIFWDPRFQLVCDGTELLRVTGHVETVVCRNTKVLLVLKATSSEKTCMCINYHG